MDPQASFSRGKLIFVNRFFHPDHSATSQMLTDLSVSLAEHGLSVHVICSRQLYDQPRADLDPCATFAGVTIHRISTTRFGRDGLMGRGIDYASFYWRCAWRLLRLLQHGDTVVAKTDPPLISIIAAAAAGLRGARLINWLQDVFPEIASRLGANPLPRPIDALVRKLRNRSLRSAHMNVVIGHRMGELLQECGIGANKLRVIENWADGQAAPPRSPHESQLRARLQLNESFVVGYSGNLGRAHEFHTVLEAATLLKDDPGFLFLFVGGGTGMTSLRNAVEARAMQNFRFLPHVPRESLADALAAPDVHLVSLLPALEGLIVPSKFYGVLAAARPVVFIGAEDGELARVTTAFEVGLNVAVGDAAQLAHQLRVLKGDVAMCRKLGQNAYQLYLEKYSKSRALDEWLDILRDMEPLACANTAPGGVASSIRQPGPPSRA